MISMQHALTAKEKVRRMLASVPGISGVGVSWAETGEPCVRVNVRDGLAPGLRRKIPARIDGVDVQVEVAGEITLERRAARA
jgi:hypothetical protein